MSIFYVLAGLMGLRPVARSEPEAEKLFSNMKQIQKVLDEAKQRRSSGQRVDDWIRSLQDVSNEIIEALDEWHSSNVACISFLEKVCSVGPCSALCFNFRFPITRKLEELNSKVDLISYETSSYKSLFVNPESRDVKRVVTSRYIDIPNVIGRKDDRDNLINSLLFSDGGIQIISVEGIAGIGKTTLAKLAYSDHRVDEHFDTKLWLCVSAPVDWVRVAKAIHKSWDPKAPCFTEFHMLLEGIKHSVGGKKFLLVLDDVCIKDDKMWSQIKTSLTYGAPGSRILITTRNERVGELMGVTKRMPLSVLSVPECESLLNQMAFFRRSDEDYETLRDIGWRIAEKCKGMPISAKIVGSHLRFKYSEEEWQNVLERESWPLKEAREGIFPLLEQTYGELPRAVKRCFRFCSVFPKDSELNADVLVRIWMAQGFLSSNEMELKGQEFVDGLAQCYFFQDIEKDPYSDQIKAFKLPYIVYEFAQSLITAERPAEKVRRFFYEDEDPRPKFVGWKSVRVLVLSKSKVQELTSDIGNLVHLRYLDISYSPVRQLPLTLYDLYNLQTLDLQSCDQLRELPQGIHKLNKLRHLLLQGSSLKHLPEGLQRLTSLQTLDKFTVGKGVSLFGTLKDMNKLHGSLCIEIGDLNEEKDILEAEKAELKTKIYVNDLRLFFFGKVRMEVFEAMVPPPYLVSLHISGYKGLEFPGWFTTSLSELKVLKLENFDCFSELPPLGMLPSLEELDIVKMKSLRYIGREFLSIVLGSDAYDALMNQPLSSSVAILFPKLRRLKFEGCESWKTWEDLSDEEDNLFSVMPFLEALCISDCTRLKGLPCRLLSKPKSLKLLVLSGYKATQFPSLITTSLHELKELKLENFDYCSELPPLGILPYLEELDITKMSSLKYIGNGFLGAVAENNAYNALRRQSSSSSSKAILFPKLRRLRVMGCESWELWEDLSDEVEKLCSIMPLLEELHVSDCHRLKGIPHRLLCKAQSLKVLRLSGYKGNIPFLGWMMSLNVLKVLKLEGFDCCSRFPPLGRLPCLEELDIAKMGTLIYLGHEFLGIVEESDSSSMPSSTTVLFPKLRGLKFEGCESWETWQDLSDDERNLPSIMPLLQDLHISDCCKLRELPHGLLLKAESLRVLRISGNSPLLVKRYNLQENGEELVGRKDISWKFGHSQSTQS